MLYMRRCCFGVLMVLLFSSCFIHSPKKVVYDKVVVGNYEVHKYGINAKGDSGFAILTGKVVDAEFGKPLRSVMVLIEDSKYSIFSDDSGCFKLTIPIGLHIVRTNTVGNTNLVTEQILFNNNDSVDIKFRLGYTLIY